MLGTIGSFNPEFYKKIVKQSLLKSIGFLVVFICLFTAIISYKDTLFIKARMPEVIRWLEKNLNSIAAEFPAIEISNGKLVSPQKTYIKKWKNGFVFVIEPEEENAGETLKKYPNVLILSERSLSIKTTDANAGRSKIETYDLKNVKELKIIPTQDGLRVNFYTRRFELTPENIKRLGEKISKFIYPVVFLFLFSIYSFTKPLQVLVFSIIALLFKANLKSSLSYRELVNISIYAVVPPTSLAVIIELAELKIPLFFVVYSIVYIVYLFLGIKAGGIQR